MEIGVIYHLDVAIGVIQFTITTILLPPDLVQRLEVSYIVFVEQQKPEVFVERNFLRVA